MRIVDEALRFAKVGLYRYRFDGTILDMNEAALEILGLRGKFSALADIIGQNIEQLIVYVGPRRRIRDLIREYGEARDVLYPFRTLDGEERWVLHDSFCVSDPDSGDLIVQAIIKDFTELHRAEDALRESEERFRGAFDYAGVGMVLVAADGRILRANRVVCEMLGYSEEGLLSRRFQDVSDPKYVASYLDNTKRLLEGQTDAFEMEMQYIHQGGNVVWGLLFVSAVHDSRRRLLYFVSQVQDITDRKRLEGLRDEFLSTAAHELETPVATIKGHVQLMLRWSTGEREPRSRSALEIVNRQCNRISRLIGELLEVSRLQVPQVELHLEVFDVQGLVAEVLAEMQAASPAHRLLLHQQSTAQVEADRDRIAQVQLNLLDNAVKYSPQGGDVLTTVRVEDGEAVVCVQDHGVGIPKDRQDHVFERYYRAHAGTAYDYGGIGVGLYICKEWVARHGGRVWFHSEEGQGSTFCFSLPTAEGREHD